MFKHFRTSIIFTGVYLLVSELIPAGFAWFKTTFFWETITDPYFWTAFIMGIAFPFAVIGIFVWSSYLNEKEKKEKHYG